jgi:hypothetical protein
MLRAEILHLKGFGSEATPCDHASIIALIEQQVLDKRRDSHIYPPDVAAHPSL